MLTILHVEDDADDRELFRYAFARGKTPVRLCTAEDGETAQSYLAGDGRHADRRSHPFPDLVLLDLKLPRRSGFEVLEWIRSRPELADLPVIVLTSSGETRDIERAYALGANSYLVKCAAIDELAGMAHGIAQYLELAPRRRA